MIQRSFNIVLALALILAIGLQSNAAVVYQYGFENLPGNNITTATPWTGTPDVLATGLSNSSWATNYTGGLFISYAGSCGTTACQALSISHNNYPSATTYTLTFTVNSGYSLAITGLSFWDKESNTGPTTANITINGTAAVSSLALAGATGANTGALTPVNSFSNLTGTVTLVMTLSGATSTSGTFRLDDFVIDGTVSSTSGITAYNVTGGGGYCAGGAGMVIGLAGSDTGVSYQLKNSGNVNVGAAVQGTGSAISFGLQTTAGTYTVLATKNSTLATATMTGSATITINPLPVVSLGTPGAQCGGTVLLDAGNAGSTFLWSDNSTAQTVVVFASATYTVTVTNTNLCSATGSAAVTINAPPSLSFGITFANICAGSPTTITASGANSYVWSNGATTDAITVQPTITTTYTVTASSSSNCTATGASSVNVTSSVTSNVTTQICQGLAYAGHTATAVYIDTFSTAGGCDSIRTLNLTVWPVSNVTSSHAICAGQSYGGHSASGTYSDTLTSVNGCDSIITLQLTVSPAITSTFGTSICAGQSYNGHTTAGTYTDTLTAVSGCDSIRTVNLIVLPAVAGTNTTQTICNGASYNGHTISGTFSDTLTASGGCDSVVGLTLTVLPQPSTAFSRSICQRDTFMGHTTTGLYTDTLTAASGCDSIIYLNLTVHALPHVTLYLTFDTVCNNAASIIMSGGSPAGGFYTGHGIVDSLFVPSVAPLGKDTIYYNFVDSNGCYKNRYEFAYTKNCVDSATGIDEEGNAVFHIMPNPTQDYVTIENTGLMSGCVFGLYDMLGRLIMEQPLSNDNAVGKTTVDLKQLPSGVYLLHITRGNNKVYSSGIVKE